MKVGSLMDVPQFLEAFRFNSAASLNEAGSAMFASATMMFTNRGECNFQPLI